MKLLEERVAEGIEDNKRFFQKYVEMRALAYQQVEKELKRA